MEQSYKKYLSYTQRELEIKLNRERDKMTPLERREILQAVGEERKRLRSVQAKKKRGYTYRYLLLLLNIYKYIDR